MENLSPNKLHRTKGILFLPNHPAILDPFIIFSLLWSKFSMRPLPVEYIYRNPLLYPFMRFMKAIPIPNFENSVNQYKIAKIHKIQQEVVDRLKQGDSFILAPAGTLKNTGKELLGGTSAIHSLIQAYPEVNIVLIRTTGLWGSSFSRAYTGKTPDIKQGIMQGAKTLLKNLIFFSPRRKVLLEIEANPPDFPRTSSRRECNKYLEDWYNRYPDEQGNIHNTEPLKRVSYSMWKSELLEVPHSKKGPLSKGHPVTEETRSAVTQEIRRILNDPTLSVRPEMSLAFDLGMDSLNLADLAAFIVKKYEVEEFTKESLETVQDVLEVAAGANFARMSEPMQAPSFHWPDEPNRPKPEEATGRTIPESFLNICDKMNGFAMCGDDTAGVLSYKKMKLAVLVLAERFRSIPETYVAVMLPASAGTFITTLALQFAGKVPVMLNWTLGSRYLEQMMAISGAKTVLTSYRFIDRLSQVDFGSLIDQMVLLEDVRSDLSFSTKLKGSFWAKMPSSAILRAFNLYKLDENQPCVVLFTSGTEANPKGVPLSHKNVLSNIKSLAKAYGEAYTSDIFYAILPPFHSFGFTTTGMLTLLSGVKVVFYPDPTNTLALIEGIERWKITVFIAPPSFIVKLFNLATREQLKSLRLFIAGGEKPPQELANRIKEHGALFLEGYGITECSAAMTLTRPNKPRKGVGQLLAGYELCTVHPETGELLPNSANGELCVRGNGVFSGYLGNLRSPFIEIGGKSWYRTGDLGHVDEEGTLYLSGRLKRFTKLAGEMISLGAVEEALIKELIDQGQIAPNTHALAVCSDERLVGKPQLILFTTVPIDKEATNQILKKAGFSNLIKISAVKKVDEIPLLSIGKTDYRRLHTYLTDS